VYSEGLETKANTAIMEPVLAMKQLLPVPRTAPPQAVTLPNAPAGLQGLAGQAVVLPDNDPKPGLVPAARPAVGPSVYLTRRAVVEEVEEVEEVHAVSHGTYQIPIHQ